MIGYFCATPFHITAAITMQGGMFAGEKGTLIILNHFNVTDELVERIRATGVFEEVRVIENDYRTLWGNVKRALNVFFPIKPMRDIANKTGFSHFVCFALDYMDLSYIMRRYRKRGVDCAFSYGDDGLGTYINEGIFTPTATAAKLLKLCGRLGELEPVRTVYAYRPEYMVANLDYDIRPIEQSPEACRIRREAVTKIWPLTEDVHIDGGVLYFEQPVEKGATEADLLEEQVSLRKAMAAYGAHAAVKLHPRTTWEDYWQEFDLIKTKMPYEVMLLQKQCSPVLMMTVSSTALFSTYLFADLPAATCPAILLYRQRPGILPHVKDACDRLCAGINAAMGRTCIYTPATQEELDCVLSELTKEEN